MLRWLWIVKDGIRTVWDPLRALQLDNNLGGFQSEVPYRKLGSHVRTDCKFPPPVSPGPSQLDRRDTKTRPPSTLTS